MNDIVNKFLLTGDNFIPEMHLKQQEFTYSTCQPFTKSQEKIKKLKKQKNKTGDTKYIQLFFNMIWHYDGFKELAKRTTSDIVLREKAFNIAKNQKNDSYQRDL